MKNHNPIHKTKKSLKHMLHHKYANALFLGLTGGVFSFWNAYVDASTLFNPMLSVKTFFILTLSLSLPTYGPLLWSFFFEMLFELLWSKFLMLHGLLLGIAIVLLILFFPRGVVWKRS